ncbi:MAG: hypothetical protein AB7U44_08880 [Sulfuricurvum sp.]
MNSIVLELQKEALDQNISITTLLRKALLAAKKLKVIEFENWILNELNGYENHEIPDYRKIKGIVKAYNPYHGWKPIIFSDKKFEETLSYRDTGQPIAEIEQLINTPDHNEYQIPIPSHLQKKLMKAIGYDTEITFFVPETSLVKIIDIVRTSILNWTLKLEEDGIQVEHISFKQKENTSKTSTNINYFYGPVTNSQFQHESPNPNQIINQSALDLSKLTNIIYELEESLNNFSHEIKDLEELKADIATLKLQINSPKPKNSIIKHSLESVKTILEGTSSNVLASLFIKLSELG